MASVTCHSVSVSPIPKPLPNQIQLRRRWLSTLHRTEPPSRSLLKLRSSVVRAANSAASSSSSTSREAHKEEEKPVTSDDHAISIDVLRRFFDLNSGKWTGSFFQFDSGGKILHKLDTKLSVSSYGEDELISLIQTLYVKQPSSRTSISGLDDEPEWAEYKIKETNMFTVEKYQQIGYFPDERAFALRYQTVGMLETVLRQGVLGEDDIGEESPRNLKLPSQRPSIVCESCMYSLEKDMRVRAFHIMDPKGVLEMLMIFLEERGEQQGLRSHPSLSQGSDDTNRVLPFLGTWKGRSMTKRSGVYGATIAEADTVVTLEMDKKGQLIQNVATTARGSEVTTNVNWTGIVLKNQVIFDKGYQTVMLPGGMYMGCPCDISKSVAETEPFHLEFCWVESPGTRQRVIRTFDVEGLAVSTTYVYETKIGN